jgi:hypothetical protein
MESDDALKNQKSAFATTRGMRLEDERSKRRIPDGVSTLKDGGGAKSTQENSHPSKVDLPSEDDELDALPVMQEH